MTTLLITSNPERKSAKFKGTIAAGEHVAVTIKDGAEWNDEGLTLRVIDFTTMRTLAVFPRPAEVLEDGEEPDEWGTTQSGDLTCTLNLNTLRMVNAARHMIHVPVLFVLGNSTDTRTLYFRDQYEVELWPERIGDDVPYDLDKWPKQIDEWTEQMEAWANQMQAFNSALSAEAEARASGDTPLSGQVINTNTPNALRQAVKTIGAALGATMRVLAACAVLPLMGATVQTVPYGELDLDQNPSVVTNVDLSGLLTEHQDISGKADKTNTYSKAETDALLSRKADSEKVFTNGNWTCEWDGKTLRDAGWIGGWKKWTESGMDVITERMLFCEPDFSPTPRWTIYLHHGQGAYRVCYAATNAVTLVFTNNASQGTLYVLNRHEVSKAAYSAEIASAKKEISEGLKATVPSSVSNVVTKSYVESLGIESGLQSESDPVWEREKPGYATTNDVNDVARAFETNVVRAVITNRVYNLTPDYELGVVWRKAASNGAFYERCYTNDTSTVEAVP